MIGLLAFLIPLTLFLSFPSTFWNFDGVACAAALELGQPAYFFHFNHLLYGAAGYLFWKGIGFPLGILRALPALQLLNSLLAAASLFVIFRILEPLLKNRWVAFLLTTSLGMTAAFWVWSIEAQVYPLGLLALSAATLVLLKDESRYKYIGVGLLHAGAILGHVLNTLWIIPALYWITSDTRLAGPERKTALRQYTISLGLATLIPYLLVVGLAIAPGRPWVRILIWLKGSAGLTPDRHWAWHTAGWRGPWIWLKSTVPSLWGSFWPYGHPEVSTWVWILTGVSIVIFIFLLIRGSMKAVTPAEAGAQSNIGLGSGFRRNDVLARFAWLWIGSYGLFLSTWEPGTLCYRMTDVIPLGLVLALGLKTLKTPIQILLMALFLGSTLAVNVTTRIGPMRHTQFNPVYQDMLGLSKITAPDTLYITQGGLSWIYFLYFTGRTAWNARSFEPGHLAEEISRQKGHRPVYIQKGSSWQRVQ